MHVKVAGAGRFKFARTLTKQRCEVGVAPVSPPNCPMPTMPMFMRLPLRLTLAVLWVGVAMAAAAGLLLGQRLHDDSHALFMRNVERVAQEVSRRLRQPVHELEGVAALYGAVDGVEATQFRAYVESRELARHFPGVLGFGFVQRERADPLVAPMGAPMGAPRPHDRYLTRRIEPAAAYPGAIGLDQAKRPRLREAIERAIATGQAAVTARLDLGEVPGPPTTLQLYVPVYRGGQTPATPALRDAALVGLLYAPIDVAVLLSDIFDVTAGRLNFELLDRAEPAPPSSRLLASVVPSAERHHAVTQGLSLLGRSFSLRAHSTPEFDLEEHVSWPWWVFALGTFCSALMAGLIGSQASSRQRAEALAGGMTAELAQLALVARETSNAVVITDAARLTTWVNAGFERITGYSAAEALGRSPGALLQFEGTDPETVRRMREALDAGLSFSGDVLNRDKHGRADWLRLHIQPLHDAAGALTGFMAVETDITELVDATAAAERANRAKSEFLAMISHELRTPLQSIVGFSELGEHFAQGQPQFVQMFGDILGGGQRMLALVNSLLDVAKIEGTPDAPVLRAGDLGLLAAEVTRELWPQAAGRHLQIVLASDLPRLPVRVDAFRIQQVLRNVLANATRFAPEGSAIEVSGTVSEGQAVLEVRDHGPGIPEAELESIFEPFVQSSRTRGGVGGSGLGLTISRKILRAHGGWIEARPVAGGGACLRIGLPVDPDAPGTPDTATDAVNDTASNTASNTAHEADHHQGINI
jgi:PAS domain S-box-containing protein